MDSSTNSVVHKMRDARAEHRDVVSALKQTKLSKIGNGKRG